MNTKRSHIMEEKIAYGIFADLLLEEKVLMKE